MATVTAPLMSAEARGRVGGLVYNTFRGIATVKAKCAPAQPRTALQLERRAIGIRMARLWQSLTAQQRSDWNDYATAHPVVGWTGNSKRWTGLNWYTACNSLLFFHGFNVIDSPPAVPAPSAPTDFTAVGAAAEIEVDWSDPGAPDDRVIIMLQGPHSAGQIGRFPRARYNTIAAGNTSPVTISNLAPGTYDVWIKSFSQATGLCSPMLTAQTAVS